MASKPKSVFHHQDDELVRLIPAGMETNTGFEIEADPNWPWSISSAKSSLSYLVVA